MQLQHKDCSLKKYLFFEIFLLLRNHTCVKCHIQLSRRIAFLSFQFIDSALLECCLLHSGARCLPGFLWISVSCYCFKSLKKKEQYPSFFFYLFVWFTVIPEINCVSACFCWKEQTVSKTFCCIFRLDELSTDNWRCLMFCWICRTGGQTFLAECSESYMFMNSIDLDTKIKK